VSDQTYTDYEAKVSRARELRAEIMPDNRRVLFDALRCAGIAVVNITFDGVGDSGQVDMPEAFGPDNEALPLPNGNISIKTINSELGCIVETEVLLTDYLEELAYDLLESTHSGWEDNEGAYGEFKFMPSKSSITLEYNERYIETQLHSHEF